MFEYKKDNELSSDFYDVYEIKEGDTLYKISQKYDVNTKLLAELNGLNLDDYIYAGELLNVPKKDVSYYITKEGDTIKIVSKIFNVKEEDLLRQNETIYLLPEQMIYFKRDD